ncbi:hypothetical protein Cgig2_002681 [Carnegiea gigantea]|uniref:Uncharacterized protein n=1 Tax=Carnegiea gigantea TaxID=171969 RepID=A0A9Q1K2R7_9CARY|nr:hypothetical protein Cgig2_002681 [Carnegiea gigantea]
MHHQTQVLTATLDDRTLLSEAAGYRKVSNTQSKPQNAKDRMTQYNEDTFPNVHELIGRKQKNQHQTETRWLEKYDPWDTSLNLPKRKVLIDEEDQRRRRWNVERGQPPIGRIHEVMLERGGHVRKRDRDEQLPKEHGRGKIIKRIDYHIVALLVEADLKHNPNKEDLVSCPQQLQLESNDVHIIHIAMDNFNTLYLLLMIQCRNLHIPYVPDNMTTVAQAQQGKKVTQMHTHSSQPYTSGTACGSQNVIDCLSADDMYYCSLEFLELVDQVESMAREKMQQKKRMGFSLPSFSLGTSPEKEPCATHSIDTTPATLQFALSPKTAPSG